MRAVSVADDQALFLTPGNRSVNIGTRSQASRPMRQLAAVAHSASLVGLPHISVQP